ncbi:MAG: SDR family NAD(P)-dependent oxidoreductase [Bacteroidota bacterium]
MKTILITGSTDGIGKLAAIKLAKEGHQVLLHGRNREKLENTIAETKKIAENDKVSGFVANLSDFSSIYPMISQLSSEVSAVDVLINNAGVFNIRVERNQDGLDMRFAVNYLPLIFLPKGYCPYLEKVIRLE